MISVDINSEVSLPFPPALLHEAAERALQSLSMDEGASLTIVVGDDSLLQQLNHEFLGIDAPTDVLSFPSDEIDPETGSQYLGDIIISLERAQRQADAAGHPLASETRLLVVHGVLHLLGYDHAGLEEKKRMWLLQAQILDSLGLAGISIPDQE